MSLSLHQTRYKTITNAKLKIVNYHLLKSHQGLIPYELIRTISFLWTEDTPLTPTEQTFPFHPTPRPCNQFSYHSLGFSFPSPLPRSLHFHSFILSSLPSPTMMKYRHHRAANAASFPRSALTYLFKEQRFLFILLGALIATSFFLLHPFSSLPSHPTPSSFLVQRRDKFPSFNLPSRVPTNLKKPGLRIAVTGGAGFVGSHLVDKLLARGDSVIVVDNFFTGRKDNLVHHFGNPRFELIRHDVVEPILLEVDQIYHLACPASPVHYKFNPIKTIISFYL
jgi:GDP-mannose 4,6 dehydratase